MHLEATIIADAVSHGICFGQQELRCYNIGQQEPTGDARINERASLVVSITIRDAAHIPLRWLIDTGSGVSILTFSSYYRLAVDTGTLMRRYGVDLYAANGRTIKTFGLAGTVRFQLGGYELEKNFVGIEDFLLGLNFLRIYQVLVDLTAMKVIVRASSLPTSMVSRAR